MKVMIRFIAGIALFAGAGCTNDQTTAAGAGGAALSGHIYWVSSADIQIHKLDLATGNDVVLGFGHSVDKASDGQLILVGRSGIEESDETLVTTRVIMTESYDSKDDADVNPTFPRVSPDGTKVAYQTLADNSFVRNRADGTVVARFEHTGATDGFLVPSWTPDGRLVLAGGFANPGLYLTDNDLTTPTRFDPNLQQPGEPSVSPDGTKVAFILKNLVYVINIDGTGLTQIDPTTDSTEDHFPAWSPDGSHVAYFAPSGRLVIRPAGGGDGIDLFDVYPALADKLLVISSSTPMVWTN
jgi:Tol biopolymer transport system component